MDTLNVIVKENNQVNEEKPPPRVCPRCSSDKTRFCYYNNYCVSQPRYNCRNCRRFWTHGGALRDIPIGGSARKIKRTSIDQASVSEVVSVIQQVNHHQPSPHAQETNEFLGTFGGSSSSVSVGNQFSSSSETHGDMVPPIRSIPPMDRFGVLFNQGYYSAGFNVIGNPLMNQSLGGHVYNYNSYLVNHEDPNKRNQTFNNKMNHSASTSGSRGYPATNYMINNKCVFRSSSHGP